MKRHVSLLVILASLFVGIAYADEHDYEIIVDGVWPEPTPVPVETCTPETCDDELVYPPDEPLYEVTVEPTEAPTETPTAEPTEIPTEPTWEPTVEPTEIPTIIPTEVPTEIPTEVPTEIPTTEPIVEPTAEPIPEPTIKPALIPNVASFSCTPTLAHIGEPITCIDTTLNASYAWQWHWSDGTSRSYGKTANHTYTVPGVYDVWHSAQSKPPFASGAIWKFNYLKVRPLPSMQIDVAGNTTASIVISQKPKYLTIVGENESILGTVEFAPLADNYTVSLMYNETEQEV